MSGAFGRNGERNFELHDRYVCVCSRQKGHFPYNYVLEMIVISSAA